MHVHQLLRQRSAHYGRPEGRVILYLSFYSYGTLRLAESLLHPTVLRHYSLCQTFFIPAGRLFRTIREQVISDTGKRASLADINP